MIINKRVCDICGAEIPEGFPVNLPLEGDGPERTYDLCAEHLKDVWCSLDARVPYSVIQVVINEHELGNKGTLIDRRLWG